uniref:RING-type E3 ubiquitin transferase n=2 Tax=Cajanus cajan TaxID=3821 RepID=A0A151RKJ6_CAJCA|nr:RING finger protein 115 family [Cajanus cajan]
MFNIQLQHFRHQPTSEGHVFEADQSDCSMNSIRRVRVSEIDKLSHCPICMDEFKVGDQACRLPCNHTYCSECILRWLNNSKTCPVCRLNLDGCRFDSIDDNGLDSQPEIPPLPPSPPVVHNEASWEYFFPDFPGIPGVENSAGGDSDEANYDSACDELVDSHEDDASQSDSAPLI